MAMVYGGSIYASPDSGVTWTGQDTNRIWYAAASSSDGSKVVAMENGGFPYTQKSIISRTTVGVTGSLSGAKNDAIELQYVGSNKFIPLSATSYSGGFVVR